MDDDAAFMAARSHATQLRDAGAGPHDDNERSRRPSTRGARAGTGAHFTISQIGIAWTLYSRWEPFDAAGIVVEILHHPHADPDTGEIGDPETVFYLYAYWRPSNPYRYLPGEDVDLTALGGIDRMGASAAIRQLVRPLAMRRRVQLSASELEAVRQAAVLARAVAL